MSVMRRLQWGHLRCREGFGTSWCGSGWPMCCRSTPRRIRVRRRERRPGRRNTACPRSDHGRDLSAALTQDLAGDERRHGLPSRGSTAWFATTCWCASTRPCRGAGPADPAAARALRPQYRRRWAPCREPGGGSRRISPL